MSDPRADGAPIGWVDCSAGVSGDMLLGALQDVGAIDVAAFAAHLGLRGEFTTGEEQRSGLRGVSVTVRPDDQQPHRRLADLLALVDAAALEPEVAARARAVFQRLAIAESRVHGGTPDDVHFHEVGAVDTIIDVVGVCQGMTALGLARLAVSTISLGGGEVATSHGTLPVPGPAVLELLAGSRLLSRGGPVDVELATPTGVALLAELADATGPLPAMDVQRVGVGLGSRELADRPNALRLVLGVPTPAGVPDDDDWLLLEANVDDLDPRLWPAVLARLLDAGAGDAWLTPILMKKGRPAHTVSVLVAPEVADAAARVLFTESSTIGVRTTSVGKRALDRAWVTVAVDGHDVRVKVARLDGRVVNAVPEYDDVAAAAAALSRPVKAVLAAANAAAANLLDNAGEA